MSRFVTWVLLPIMIGIFFFIHSQSSSDPGPNSLFSQIWPGSHLEAHVTADARQADSLTASEASEQESKIEGPYLAIDIPKENRVSLVIADGQLTSLAVLDDRPLRITLKNSSEFEIIRMYGSTTLDFESPHLVFDWTARKINNFLFTPEFLKKYPFYLIRWKSVLSESHQREAKLTFSQRTAPSPTLVLTYQMPGVGTQTSQLQPKRGENKIALPAKLSDMKLLKSSLFVLNITGIEGEIISCSYVAPKSQSRDCRSWQHSDYIQSLTESDLGWHKMVIETNLGKFEYHFEISRLL